MHSDELRQLEESFKNDTYQLFSQQLKNNPTPLEMEKLLTTAYHMLEDFLVAYLEFASSNNETPVCQKGCAWCCHQSILVLPYEAWYAYRYFKQNNPMPVENFKTQLELKNKTNQKKPIPQFIHQKAPCPFLHENACSIYSARPMACRTYLSKNVQLCEYEYQNPTDTKKFPPLFHLPLQIGRKMNEGICTALREKGIIAQEGRFEWFLKRFKDDETLFEHWLRGKIELVERLISTEEWSYLQAFEKKR